MSLFCWAFLLPAFTLGGREQRDCSRDVVCVVAETRRNRVDFVVENRQLAKITLTIELELENLKSNGEVPHTATYPGNRRTLAFTLSPISAGSGLRWRSRFAWRWGSLDASHDDSFVYALPYESGRRFKVTQGFNGRFTHVGDERYAIDWGMPEGTPVLAARGGMVVASESGFSAGGPEEEYKERANFVTIEHDDGTFGQYLHLQRSGVKVALGHTVRVGDLLGFSGATGYARGSHLHFIVFKALDGENIASYPIRFHTREGAHLILEQGARYTAP